MARIVIFASLCRKVLAPMTGRTRFAILIVTAPVLAYTLVGGFLGQVVAREDSYRHLRVFEDVVSLVSSNYVEPIDPERIMQGALWGLAEGLDPDSSYLNPDELKHYEAGDTGNEVGVGLVLRRQYYIRVVAAREGSPAAKAGLLPGDYIRAIDDNPTRMMSVIKGDRLLRGEPGSTVTLTVIRGNAAEPLEMEIERSSDRSASVTSRLISPELGYLRISEFDDTATEAIQAATEAFEQQNIKRLLIDLRGNANGKLESGLDAARLFSTEDTLAIRESTDEQVPVSILGRAPSVVWPVAIITNPGTAGAAELFAAALTDAGRAETVGLRTAGRTAEQTLVRLPDGGGLLISSTRYLTASGNAIHRVGVEPVIVVQEPVVELGRVATNSGEDPVLDRAIEHLMAMPTA